jgi:AraC-like DNA-binding protein
MTFVIVYDSRRMDAVTALLHGPRARGAFVLRSSLTPPWCLRIEDRAPLTIGAVVRGEAWVMVDDDPDGPAHLAAGDVMVCRGPHPYVVADRPDTPPQVVIGPGQQCTTVDGSAPFGELEQSVRTWGNAADGQTLLFTGTYETAGQASQRLLSALPPLSVVRRDEWENPLLDVLDREAAVDQPGQAAILDRLVDLLCLTTVRACLTRPDAAAPGWFRAATDPVIGPALELIHNNPGHPWTVAALGAAVGASRAGFARRFTELVGEPPLTYLTRWRLDLAADQLAEPDLSVARIAAAVGYDNPFAFSNAFKRHTGVSPTHFRQQRAG